MRTPWIFVFVLTIPLFAQSSADGKDAESSSVWAMDHAEAWRAYRQNTRPLVGLLVSEKDERSSELFEAIQADEGLQGVLSRFICLVGSVDPGKKTSRKPTAFGRSRGALKTSGLALVRSVYGKTDTVKGPQLVVLGKGAELLHIEFTPTADALAETLMRVLYHFDPKLVPEAYRRDEDPLDRKLRDEIRALGKRLASKVVPERVRAIKELVGIDHPAALAHLRHICLEDLSIAMRVEAAKAMLANPRPIHFPIFRHLIRTNSQQLRQFSILFLRKLGRQGFVPALVDCFNNESSSRNLALVLRTGCEVLPDHPKIRRIHAKCLNASKILLRVHGTRACLDFADPQSYKKVIGLAFGDTSATVRRSALYASVTVGLRTLAKVEEEQANGRQRLDKATAAMLKLTKTKLLSSLRLVAAKDRNPKHRDYAEQCLRALKNRETSVKPIDTVNHDNQLFGKKPRGQR